MSEVQAGSVETAGAAPGLTKIFGIDLGTTFSCIASVDQTNRPVVHPNSDTERITPSVVYFKGGNDIVVGRVAKELAELYPDRVSSMFKREMGEPDWHFEVDGKQYRPQILSSFVLKKVVEDAENHLKEKIRDVVITCPAWFNLEARNATREAGELLELNVHAILNEPTAAAIAYGMEAAKDETVLVYDLGGGTFDITMIDILNSKINVICTDGNHKLGGRDWDQEIVNYLIGEACQKTGEDEDELRKDSELRQDLFLKAERAKIKLGSLESTTVKVITPNGRANVELTRNKFEELTSHLLEATIALTRNVLEQATTERKNRNQDPNRGFHKILMVGGSTKMPQVEAKLKQEFSAACEAYDQDESVARGAAIYGRSLAINQAIQFEERKQADQSGVPTTTSQDTNGTPSPESQKQREAAEETVKRKYGLPGTKIIVENVVSHTYGAAVLNESNQLCVFNMIQRNTPVPAHKMHVFATSYPNQTAVELGVFENDSVDVEASLEDSREIVKGEMNNLPPNLPAGHPISVTFTINENGLLEGIAREETSQSEVKVQMTIAGSLTPEEMKKQQAEMKAIRSVRG